MRSLKLSNITAGIFSNNISDHLGTFLNIHANHVYNFKERPHIRIMNEKNMKLFKSKLVELDQMITSDNHSSSNELWNIFINQIKGNFNVCFPLMKISRSKYKDKPWITPAIKTSSKTKEKLYKKFMKNKTSLNELRYKQYKNQFNKIIKIAKQKHTHDKLSNDVSNKVLWSEINNMMGKTHSKVEINSLVNNGQNLTEPLHIANYMTHFFSSIGEQMGKDLKVSPFNKFKKFMPPKLNKSIFLTKMSPNEVLKIIDNFHNKTSAGDDMISQKLLRNIKNEIVNSLTKLINMSIDEAVYPDILKVCKVIPVYKNGNPQDINNYRPISLLSSFNKVFEKKIQIDLANFIDDNKILCNQQFGFRKYHSTIDALISTHDYIIDTLNKK